MTTVSILHNNNGACKYPYKTTLPYSLVNGIYKMTTESIKLVLDMEQFRMGSDLIIPTPDVQKVL